MRPARGAHRAHGPDTPLRRTGAAAAVAGGAVRARLCRGELCLRPAFVVIDGDVAALRAYAAGFVASALLDGAAHPANLLELEAVLVTCRASATGLRWFWLRMITDTPSRIRSVQAAA